MFKNVIKEQEKLHEINKTWEGERMITQYSVISYIINHCIFDNKLPINCELRKKLNTFCE